MCLRKNDTIPEMKTYLAVDLQDTLFRTQPRANAYTQEAGITNLISVILPNVYLIAGLILLVYLVAGGVMLIGAGNSHDQAAKGQKAITNAIIGFIVIFTSYWIIQAVQVITGVPILTGI